MVWLHRGALEAGSEPRPHPGTRVLPATEQCKGWAPMQPSRRRPSPWPAALAMGLVAQVAAAWVAGVLVNAACYPGTSTLSAFGSGSTSATFSGACCGGGSLEHWRWGIGCWGRAGWAAAPGPPGGPCVLPFNSNVLSALPTPSSTCCAAGQAGAGFISISEYVCPCSHGVEGAVCATGRGVRWVWCSTNGVFASQPARC